MTAIISPDIYVLICTKNSNHVAMQLCTKANTYQKWLFPHFPFT